MSQHKRIRSAFCFSSENKKVEGQTFCNSSPPSLFSLQTLKLWRGIDKGSRIARDSSSTLKPYAMKNSEHGKHWRSLSLETRQLLHGLIQRHASREVAENFVHFSDLRTHHSKSDDTIDTLTKPACSQITCLLVLEVSERLRKEKVRLVLCKMMENNLYCRIIKEKWDPQDFRKLVNCERSSTQNLQNLNQGSQQLVRYLYRPRSHSIANTSVQ
jgi:hypothetical protein